LFWRRADSRRQNKSMERPTHNNRKYKALLRYASDRSSRRYTLRKKLAMMKKTLDKIFYTARLYKKSLSIIADIFLMLLSIFIA
jgi:hypothetical protein